MMCYIKLLTYSLLRMLMDQGLWLRGRSSFFFPEAREGIHHLHLSLSLCLHQGIIQMVPTLSSCDFSEIVSAKIEGQVSNYT